MKLKDLLETKIYPNNFIKIDMVKNELERIFNSEAPEINFDDDGLYIKLDNFNLRELENNPMNKFSITDAGFENEKDEVKGIKKYYIEYTKIDKFQASSTPESRE